MSMPISIPDWLVGSVAAIVASAAVRALPEPAPMGSLFYQWLYRFGNLLLANMDRASAAKKISEGEGK